MPEADCKGAHSQNPLVRVIDRESSRVSGCSVKYYILDSNELVKLVQYI